MAAAAGVFASVGTASAAINPTTNATDISSAITANPLFVTGAAFVAVPAGPPTPNATVDSAGISLPTNGSTWGLLTTGDATLLDDPNTDDGSGANLGGPNVRGDTDFDVTILRVDLLVPPTANCLSFDFRFLSEEFPEFIGSNFNDAFIAEIDTSTWDTSGSDITAPNNFAVDPNGNVISINATGPAQMFEGQAAGTTYDGATFLLQARTPITPGPHQLFLSIFDQGDRILDSAVGLDNLNLFTAEEGACASGVINISPPQAPPPTTTPAPAAAPVTQPQQAKKKKCKKGFVKKNGKCVKKQVKQQQEPGFTG